MFNTSGGIVNMTGTLNNTSTTLVVNGSVGPWELAGGTILGGTVMTTNGGSLIVNASGGMLNGVTLNGILDVGNTYNYVNLMVTNGLVLNGTALVGNPTNQNIGAISFQGTQTLSGNGTVVFGGSINADAKALRLVDGGTILTIGVGITVEGQFGSLGYNGFWGVGAPKNVSVVNQGTISADVANGTITTTVQAFTDQGSISVSAGATLSISVSVTFNDPYPLLVQPGGTLQLGGDLLGNTRNMDQWLPQGTLAFTSGAHQMEAMSLDLGNVPNGYVHNFDYGTITLASGAQVTLVDQSTNSAGPSPECVYTTSLIVPSGSTLNLNGLHLYAGFTQIGGTVTGGTVSQIPNNGGPLTFGNSAPGTISAAGALNAFTFLGRSGEQVAISVDTGSARVLSPPLGYAFFQLFDPSTNLIAQASNTVAQEIAGLASITLPVDGIYTVEVRAPASHSASTGNYLVTVWDATPTIESLVINQQEYGQITTPFSVDDWNFSAPAGEQVQFNLINAAAPGVAFDLSGPNGWVGFSNLMTSSGLVTLTYAGNYTLTALGTGGAYGFAYTFELVQTAQTNLMVGSSFTGSFAGSGQSQLFVITVTNDNPMLITLGNTGAGNVTELYVGLGTPPTRGSYAYDSAVANSSSQQILIPEAVSGTYYVLVYGNQISTPGSYTLSATTSGLFLSSVVPPTLANGVDATLTLYGAGFDPSTTVQLVASNGLAYSAQSVSVNSFSQITATFAENTVPVGLYSVLIAKADGSSAELPNIFQFTSGAQANLVTHLIVPGIVGRHAQATLYVQYANTGNAAMPAPLLLLTGTQNPVMAPILSLSGGAQFQEVFWTSVLPPGWSTTVQFLASGHIQGVLQPGESNTVAIAYAGLQEPWNFSQTNVQFSLGVIDVNNTSPLDWSSYESSMQPTDLASDAWAAIFQNLTNEMGSTWGEYEQSLDNAGGYLGTLGLNVNDIGQLISFQIRRADAMNVVRYLAGSLDAYVPTPGLALTFQRVFSENISGRYKLGTLGHGWAHNWDMTLSNAPDGSSVTILGPGTSTRTFLVNTLGGYFNSPGDYGQLTSLGSGAFTLQETDGTLREFGSTGKLNYVQDPNGNRVTCGYSGNQLTSLSHSSGPSLSIAYNGFGTIASVTDSVGRQTTFGYDSSGQHLISATYFDGSTVAYSYTDTATAAANQTLANALTQITTPTTNHEYFTYDNQGRLANMSLDGGAQSLSFSYDTAGTVFVTDSNNHISTFYLNNNGLIAKAQNPFTNSVFFGYDANFDLTTFTDPTGRSYNFAYDGNGNLTRDVDASGRTASFTYQGPFNRLASLVDANANLTTHGNDTNGNLRSITDTDGSVEFWGYDIVGDPITWTNRRGQAIIYQFNSAGQATSKTYPDGRTINYDYDNQDLLTNIADSVQGVTQVMYDSRANVTNVTYPNGSGFSFTYDSAGRRTSRIGFDGYALNYRYDPVGRLATLADRSNNLLAQYTYDATGRLSQETKGNGTFTTYSYNAAGQLVALTNGAPGGVVQSFFNYTYDAKGNKLTMNDLAGGTEYTYDDLNQLTSVTYPSGRNVTYSYDASGNRTAVSDTGTNTTYIANSLNEYAQAGGTIFGYDADGNMTSQTTASGTTTYQYDAENRLVSVSTQTNVACRYFYDALGNRSATICDGVTNHYLLDPFGLVDMAAEYDSGSNLIARYDNGLGLVATLDSVGNPAYYSFDALGNTRQMTGNSGSILNSYDYDAFGAATFASESVSNVFRFVGRFGVADEPSGLHFMRARFYDSSIGRFMSIDPENLAGRDVNLYRFVCNDPIGFSDSSGKDVDDEFNRVIGGKPTFQERIAFTTAAYEQGAFQELYGQKAWTKDIENRVIQDYDTRIGLARPLDESALSMLGTYGGSWMSAGARLTTQIIWESGNLIGDILGKVTTLYAGGTAIPPTVSTTTANTIILLVQDPNQLIGPSGYASQNFVLDGNFFAYEIIFANETNATAPAQIVKVTDPLSTNLNWATFQLTGIAFGSNFLTVPPNVQYFQTSMPITDDGVSFQLQIQAGINLGTGQVFANFNSIDPLTGLPPIVNVGFLPPENGTGIGTGHISYTISPNANLPAGLQISNIAYIQFDENPVIATDQVNDEDPSQGISTNKMAIVTIDSTPPVSSVSSLPTIETSTNFTVCWSGTDVVGPGIVSYDIYVSTNSGPWTIWLGGTTNTCATFNGQNGANYGIYSVAHDAAGIVEAPHLTADATTTVQTGTVGSPPFLTIALTGHKVVLAWPTNAGKFVFQTTTNLVSPTNWNIVTNTPSVGGSLDVVTLPITNTSQFFRLQSE